MTNVTEKALELIRSGEIERVEDARAYLVPSRSQPGVRYRVQLSESAGPYCPCEARGPCYHLLACLMREQNERTGIAPAEPPRHFAPEDVERRFWVAGDEARTEVYDLAAEGEPLVFSGTAEDAEAWISEQMSAVAAKDAYPPSDEGDPC